MKSETWIKRAFKKAQESQRAVVGYYQQFSSKCGFEIPFNGVVCFIVLPERGFQDLSDDNSFTPIARKLNLFTHYIPK